jgi:putative phage-type endonuclease
MISKLELKELGDAVFLGDFESGSPEWHELRNEDAAVGGSDIGAIAGLSPFESQITKWAKKTKQIPDNFEPSMAMRLGTKLEAPILEIFAEEHPDYEIFTTGTWAHKEFNWQRANPDALYRKPDGTWGIIEVKFSRDYWSEVPQHYRAQVLWYMNVFAIQEAVLVALAGSSYQEFEVEWDTFEATSLIAAAYRFRESVLNNKMPDWMLPWLLFAMPIGVMVDRVDRRYIFAGSNAIRSAVIGIKALGIATGHVTIYWLIFSAFIIGVCEVATDTTAQSLIPQILDKEHYEKGNSRLQISETVIQGFIGSPLSGFLYALAIWLPFFINSIGYAVATLLALSIPIQYLQDVRTESSAEKKPHFIEDIKFGIAYLYNHKVLRRLVLTTATIGVCYSMGTATMVLFIIKELELAPKYFGVILTIQGVGALLGAIVAPKASKKFGRSIMMTLGITLSSVVLLLQGFAPNIYIFVALATFGGFAIAQWNILLMATYQTVIPNELYGRIHGTRRTLVWGMMPIGSLIGGVLAHFSLRLPMYVGGVIASVIALASIKFFLSVAGTAPAEK